MNNQEAVEDALKHGKDPVEIARSLAFALDLQRDVDRSMLGTTNDYDRLKKNYNRLLAAMQTLDEQITLVRDLVPMRFYDEVDDKD